MLYIVAAIVRCTGDLDRGCTMLCIADIVCPMDLCCSTEWYIRRSIDRTKVFTNVLLDSVAHVELSSVQLPTSPLPVSVADVNVIYQLLANCVL